MSAVQSALQGEIPAGWYGKIPATGDFVVRRLPAAFSDAWDRWLQQAMEGSRERLGRRWRESYLSMPAWRFLLSADMLTPQAWAGVMMPSVDAVGRYFPLTIACPLDGAGLSLAQTARAAAAWFDGIEALALDALALRLDAARLDAVLLAQPFRESWLRRREASPDATVPFRSARALMLAVPPEQLEAAALQLAEPNALWLPGASELIERRALACENLPSAAQFCGMMEGRWREHGWSEPEPRGAGAA